MPRRNNEEQKWSDLFGNVQKLLGYPLDLVYRSVFVKAEQMIQCIYLESIVDKASKGDYILKSFMVGTFRKLRTPMSLKTSISMNFCLRPNLRNC
ncbi:hypothetical protein CULT_160041 [[Clostridium] ultunense Esp]|nr:hypothetical protein CULT_160041 [[Clostridium] ultunense Esp]